MLFPKNRLTKKEDFERVYKTGKTIVSGSIILKKVPNRLGNTRVGFAVGLKYSKKAVERNRAKRILRDAMRCCLSDLGGSWDIVLMIKKNTNINYEKTLKDLEKALKLSDLKSQKR